MTDLPLIIVVGANDLALRVCEELSVTRGHRVVVMWNATQDVSARVQAMGASYSPLPPNDYESLDAVRVREAQCIMPVSDDDGVNLQVALKARDLNPSIRIVLRQFNRALGRKIEQNLPACTAISPATHAAATFAAAALDPSCLYAMQFPAPDGPLIGFSEREARDFGFSESTVEDAERRLGLRVVAVNGQVAPRPQHSFTGNDRIVACGPVQSLQTAWPVRAQRRERKGRGGRRRMRMREALRTAIRSERLLIYAVSAGALLFVVATLYFMMALHLTFIEAMYFTASTMLTVGYGDITPYLHHGGTAAMLIAVGVMLMGVTLGGILIATASSALNRAQETALQGLRRIHADDHVIVCGAGNVGTRVIDFLLALNERVVVVERRPSVSLLELARTRRIDLIAADATSDDTLGFCSVGTAQSLVAVTDSDTANLETVLGALDRNAGLPVVMRLTDPVFSRSVVRNFKIAKSFSASDLTAPVIAGLSRFPGSRGRITFAGETYNIGERDGSTGLPRAEGTVVLYAWRAGELIPVRDFTESQPEDRLLYIVPLSQFRAA